MKFVISIPIYKGRYCMRKQEYQVKPTPDIHTHKGMYKRKITLYIKIMGLVVK